MRQSMATTLKWDLPVLAKKLVNYFVGKFYEITYKNFMGGKFLFNDMRKVLNFLSFC